MHQEIPDVVPPHPSPPWIGKYTLTVEMSSSLPQGKKEFIWLQTLPEKNYGG